MFSLSVIDPSGVFSSRGFSRASDVSFSKAVKASLSLYLSDAVPLFVHVFHGHRGAPKGGPPQRLGAREDCDRIFCSVYEPYGAPDGAQQGGASSLGPPPSGGASFFFGGSVGVGPPPNPWEIQQKLIEGALKKQQQQQQQEEGDVEMEEDESEERERVLFSNPAQENPHETWVTADPAELRAFGASYPLHGAPCRFFCSSSSSSGSNSAATAAAIARSARKDVAQTLKALEDYLYCKQQEQGAPRGGPRKKYVLLLFSTLPPSELGSWAGAPTGPGGPRGGPHGGPHLSIPVIPLEQVPKRLTRLSRSSFAE